MESPYSSAAASRTPRCTSGQRGFTLIELIIAIALLMIVMLMVMAMFSSAQSIYRTASQRAEVFSTARTALDVIEADLQKISGTEAFGTMMVESVEIPGSDLEAYIRLSEAHKMHQDTQDDEASTNSETRKLVPILSFDTTTTWFDPGGVERRGRAQVTYYIKRRREKNDDGKAVQPTSGYLMRYVVPIKDDYGSGVLTKEERDKAKSSQVQGAHNDVAGSVVDIKIYAINNAAAAYMAQKRSPAELFPRCDHLPTKSAEMLRDDVVARQKPPDKPEDDWQPAKVEPESNHTYTWGSGRGGTTQYLKTRGSYPLAIMVEITFVNDGIEELDVRATGKEYRGTLRVFRRIISIPNTEAAASLDTDDVKRFTSN